MSMSASSLNDASFIETTQLQQMKQDLIKTKPPNQTQIDEYYSRLISQLQIIKTKGADDDKYVVLLNDVLSICLLRLNALATDRFQDSNLIFDYIFQFINHPFPPLQNSLQSLLSKLLMFKQAESEIPHWIDTIMAKSGSLSKNLYLLLELLLKKIQDKQYFYNRYPEYPIDSILLFDDKVANAISKTIHVIYDGLYPEDPQQWYLVWKDLVRIGLTNTTKRRYVITYLLPNLVKKDSGCFKFLVNDYANDLEILLSLLNMGHKLEVIDEDLEKVMDSDILTNCLVSVDPQLRLNSLQLILGVDFRRLNNIAISKSTFDLIKTNYVIEINLNDSENQDKFMSIFYRFITGRLKTSLGEKNSTDSIQHAEEFISWLLILLQNYLQPGSNFQQTMGSIGILGYICEKLPVDIFEISPLIKLLIKLLFSDFKAVRNSSLELLTHCNPTHLSKFLKNEESELVSYSLSLLASLTGRVSEGGAKALQFLSIYYFQNEKEKLSDLLNKLIKMIDLDETYIHGHFAALNLIVTSVDIPIAVCQELLQKVIQVWDKQRITLSQEATGYEDEEEGDEEGIDVIDQGAIKRNYSWKLVKYSNELMITILGKYADTIGTDTISQCSELVMDQLSSIKHKGAFTSIYPSFIRLCQLCLNSDLQNLPRVWLDNNLQLIQSTTQLISRRSGGIPYLITGILIASKQDLTIIEYSFIQLLQIANESCDEKLQTKQDLPQVHAYNTLKQIFTESTLANESVRFIQDSLILCLDNFSSSNWSIRNCAVMLFGSIKQRIFGNIDKYSAKLFFSRFPKLKNVLLSYLRKFRKNQVSNQSIFPIMMILAQLDFNDTESTEFIKLLKPCLGEPAWKIRELAARALENIFSEEELCGFAERILEELPKGSNLIHGFFLCLLYGTSKISNNIATKLQQILPNFVTNQPYVVINALINILAKLRVKIDCENLIILKSFFNKRITSSEDRLDGGLQLLLNTLATFLLQQYVDTKEITHHVQLSLQSRFFNVRVAVLEYIEQDGVKVDIADIIWDLILQEEFSYVLSRALRLYSKINKDRAQDKITVLSSFLCNINESVRFSALECLGSCIQEESTFCGEFLELCTNLSKEENSLDCRKSANNAMVSYISSSGDRGNLYYSCLLLLFEHGICDDDEDIRTLSTNCLSKLCGRKSVPDSYFMSQYLPLVASVIIPDKHYSQATFNMFMRNTLDQDALRAIVEKKKKFSLYAHEKDSLHKNELELISNISKFPMVFDKQQLEKFASKVNADIEFVHELKALYGDNYWMYDYVLHEAEFRTIANAKLLLSVKDNKELRHAVELLMVANKPE
ncbi:uncharacterized protein SPAPADRAFT_49672 [Spathaspora passalidarum NRRL Y-27907]|uniref:Uncharacterized protein n=1 Tax=Spathaspora passalidarum (strain NRRL Y-27907 / 11-Y1) TaxID=619300 RepID=G3ALV8_SPAPN|nr:uncharacterized protein SPAPADRAFT_49672 [Spathaspora passalidarum NRRL Y-27907]EGW32717.1 hypothetical protein SPAPADRAFT_49672 [Spathaspora passalidarum NRRL Y-27907]